eukprot:Hpha_TRINITY_DN26139_c0_g1::TRINITY_DN26139_c0_g1_i1::g.155456::m.155456
MSGAEEGGEVTVEGCELPEEDASGGGTPVPPVRAVAAGMERVAKRQRLHAETTTGAVSSVLSSVEAAALSLRQGEGSPKEVLERLQRAVAEAEGESRRSAAGCLEALNAQLQTFEASFSPSPGLYHNGGWGEQRAQLLRPICAHLHHTGRSHVAAMLADEAARAGIDTDLQKRCRWVAEQFQELRELCACLQRRSPDEPLTWVRRVLAQADKSVREEPGADSCPPLLKGQALARHSRRPTTTTSRAPMVGAELRRLRELGFRLNRLQVISLLRAGEVRQAVQLMRGDLSQVASQKTDWWRSFLQLAGSLAFARPSPSTSADSAVNVPLPPSPGSGGANTSPAPDCPYPWLYGDDSALWRDAESMLRRSWCALWAEPAHSPLATCLAAGAETLPTLLGYMCLPEGLRGDRELHLPVLPRELRFVSTVSCPVTQQICTPPEGHNPAMLLPCGHVISRAAVETLRRGSHLKCPYCPEDCFVRLCRSLRF